MLRHLKGELAGGWITLGDGGLHDCTPYQILFG
jgi:hypothetical protein